MSHSSKKPLTSPVIGHCNLVTSYEHPKAKKKTTREVETEELNRVMETVAERAAFYRANPQRFVRDYLGITNLKWFQEVILYMMNNCVYFMYLASRGQGKTHIFAIFCCIRCILYPGTHICVVSKTRKQAQEVLDRIREQVEDEMSEATFSDVSFHMEMKALWWSDTDGGLYSHEDVERNRVLPYAWYPPSVVPSMQDKHMRIPKKGAKEKRILSADLALMASTNKKDNDAASIFINALTPISQTKCMSNIVYTENIEGMRADDLALMIRRRVEEYDCDYLVIDAKGLGLPIVDLLMKDMNDPQTGLIYGALDCCNNDEISARCAVRGAPKKIWAVMGSANFNSEAALGLREAFRQGAIRLLVSEYDCEDYLTKLSGYSKLSIGEKADLRLPYVHTTLLGNELINLEYEAKNGIIKVQEKSGMRKDRYSSLSYNIYVAKELERRMARGPRNGMDAVNRLLQFKAPTLT